MQICPECETKTTLYTMDLTPELIEEMAMQEPCADYAGDEIYKKRLDVCKKCRNLTGGMTCSICGCFVQLRAKHKTAVCAEYRWPL